MRIKQFGRTGLWVSEICLGTMTFGGQADEATAFAIMDRAFAAGVFFFDTADAYPVGGGAATAGGTETIVGNWLRERGTREQIVLATKCSGATGPGANDRGLSRKHVIAACEASLRRLGTDYIDLYQVHWPDAKTPLDETLRALDDLVRAGKVRYIGNSNFAAWQIANGAWIARTEHLTPFITAQNDYSLLNRSVERELMPACVEFGLSVLPYFPLASGVLTRFGPMYDVERMGGAFTLCAMRIPEPDFERVAALVNAHPEVAHNYARAHEFNLWFVVAAASREAIAPLLAAIEAETGYPVLDLPREQEYFIELRLVA